MRRLLLILVVLVPALARADVIGPPPSRCPAGSVGDSSHAGSNCSPTTCGSNGDCEGGHVCVEQGLCVQTWDGWSHGHNFQVDHAVTTCSDDGGCPPDATCETEKRCVSRVSAMTGGGSLAVPLAIGAVVIGVAVLLLLVVLIGGYVLVARRRRKARGAGS